MTLPSTTPRISRSLPGLVSRSLLIPVAVVATSLGLAALLHPDPVLYVLLSAPVAILVQVLRRRPLRAAWVRCAPPIKITPRLLALTWLGYLVGAVVGALLLKAMSYPLLVPAALLVGVIFLLRDHIGGVSPSLP